MYTSNLRKVGGSVMLSVPPAVMDMLGMVCGMRVSMAVEAGRLVIEPETRKEYTLEELLAQCEQESPTAEDRQWLAGQPCGRELI